MSLLGRAFKGLHRYSQIAVVEDAREAQHGKASVVKGIPVLPIPDDPEVLDALWEGLAGHHFLEEGAHVGPVSEPRGTVPLGKPDVKRADQFQGPGTAGALPTPVGTGPTGAL